MANPQPRFYGSTNQWPGPPQLVPAFSPGSLLVNVTARNLGASNNGLPEDVLVTYFDMLPGGQIPGVPALPPPGGQPADGRARATASAGLTGSNAHMGPGGAFFAVYVATFSHNFRSFSIDVCSGALSDRAITT